MGIGRFQSGPGIGKFGSLYDYEIHPDVEQFPDAVENPPRFTPPSMQAVDGPGFMSGRDAYFGPPPNHPALQAWSGKLPRTHRVVADEDGHRMGAVGPENEHSTLPLKYSQGYIVDPETELAEDHGTAKDEQPAKTRSKHAVKRSSSSKVPGSSMFHQRSTPNVSRSIASASTTSQTTDHGDSPTVELIAIQDSDRVELYLIEQFLRLQQQVGKKISKAWIKVICPNKQSRHPYQQKKRKAGEGDDAVAPPPWWPTTHICPYREPDHVSRGQRVHLLIHLLRLRPTAEQIQAWDATNLADNETLQTRGWTSFLLESTPLSLFNELAREPDDKIKRRGPTLKMLFDAARLEEDYLNGGVDGTATITWHPDPQYRLNEKQTERSRRVTVPSVNGNSSSAGSETGAKAKGKRIKQETQQPRKTKGIVNIARAPAMVRAASSSTIADDPADTPFHHSPVDAFFLRPGCMGHRTLAFTETPANTSFNSSHSGYQGSEEPQQGLHDFVDHPGWEYLQAGQAQPLTIPAYNVHELPQPHFEDTSNAMMFYPAHMGIEHHTYGTMHPQMQVMEHQHAFQHGILPFGGLPTTAAVATEEDHYARMSAYHDAHRHLFGNAPFAHREVRGYESLVEDRFPDHKPPTDLPPDTLPAHVVRGNTGHASGVGGGAMT